MKYSLYYTLNKNIDTSCMTPEMRIKIENDVSSCVDEQKKQAILLLINEHSVITSSQSSTMLPFNAIQKENDIIFKSLPDELLLILHKFLNLN